MATMVRCPKCQTVLKIAAAPPSGAIKCPKCQTVMKVGAGTGSAPSPSPSPAAPPAPRPASPRPANAQPPRGPQAAAGKPAAPPAKGSGASAATAKPRAPSPANSQSVAPPAQDDGFGGLDAGDPLGITSADGGGGDPFGGLDSFGASSSDPLTSSGLPFAAAPSQAMQSWANQKQPQTASSKPPAFGSLPAQSAAPSKPAAGKSSAGGTKSKKKMYIGLGVGGGVLFLMILGSLVYLLIGSLGGEKTAESLGPPPPPGWQEVKLMGVRMAFPGEPQPLKKGLVSGEVRLGNSDTTGSDFLFAVDTSGSNVLSDDGVRKGIERRLGGELLGPQPHQRGPMKGIAGTLSQSMVFPDTRVEGYQYEGRFIIIGYRARSAALSAGGMDSSGVDYAKEDAERNQFFETFAVGPMPGMFDF